MNRLTTKVGDKVLFPTIPMEIKSKTDLEEWHKVRREYEAMAIKLAEYEDREEKPQGIVLHNIDLTGISKVEQKMKIKEELREFEQAVCEHMVCPTEKTKSHMIEEYFDLVQSALGQLEKEGITAEEVMKHYPLHETKIKHRPREKKCSKCNSCELTEYTDRESVLFCHQVIFVTTDERAKDCKCYEEQEE